MNLSETQQSFLCDSTHSWNICSGSVSSGKTFVNNLRLYEHIYTHLPSGCLFILVGKTGESLYDNVIRDLLTYDLNGDITYHKQPQRLVIKSKGIEIPCIGADNSSSWERVQGKTTAGAVFDEITNLPENLVKTVAKGCRHSGQQWPKFATTNPDAPGHWVKKQLIDNKELDSKIWYFTLTDNPALTDDYKREIKATYTGAMYDRMILGRWTVASGIVFDQFDRRLNVKKRADLPKFKEYVMGCDWGYAHPLAIILVGIDYDGNYWIIDEIYVKNQLIDDKLKNMIVSKGWLQIDNGFRMVKPSYVYADSARPDYINLFTKLIGITTLPAAKQVIEGIQMMNSKLRPKGNGEPSLYVLDECHNWIEEVELYRWKQTRDQIKDEPEKENDHLMDATRYILFTRERSKVRVIEHNPFKGADPFAEWPSKHRVF